ncbi:hypothetical protein QJQ45_026702 [Haematococcus lacustris]|nr:hypothetical protein QJQ45_026702 [Haematococcus lacustris]
MSSPDQHAAVFLSGAISGVMEGVSVQPLEMLKTRMQISHSKLQLMPTLRDILREGGFRQLYRGGLPEITGLIPRATAALSTLEYSQRLFRSWDKDGQLTAPYAYASGSLCGVTEGVVFSPFQVIKVRLMAKEHLGRYHNTWDCIVKHDSRLNVSADALQVLRVEGPSALLIGLGPTLYRNCVWNGLYYGSMHQVEAHYLDKLDNPALELARQGAACNAMHSTAPHRTAHSLCMRMAAASGPLPSSLSFMVGIVIGMAATCFNVPFDVVKSRFQSQLPGEVRYTSTLQALTTIYREEGAQALYKGFVPKALRLGLASDFYHLRNRVHKSVSMRSRTVVTTIVHDTPTSSGRADLKAVDRLLDSKLPLGELEQERVLLEFEKLQLSSACSNRRVFGGLASALSAFFAWATWSQCVDPFGQQYTGELKAVVPGAGAAAVVLGLQAVACAATAWGMLSQLPRPGELARGCLPAPYQQWLLLTLGSLANLPCTVFWLVAHRRLDVLLGRGLTARCVSRYGGEVDPVPHSRDHIPIRLLLPTRMLM